MSTKDGTVYTGGTLDNSLAAKFKAAEDKKKKALAGAPLPDLTGLVPEMTAETLEAKRAEGEKRREWAETAGVKLAEIESRIATIEADDRLLLTCSLELSQLKSAQQRILQAGDKSLQDHVGFSRLLREVQETNRDDEKAVMAMAAKIVASGRYRVVDEAETKAFKTAGKWPSGTIFLAGVTYLSVRGDTPTAGQKALEAEFRKMADEYKTSRMAQFKAAGDHDLSRLLKGKPGTFYLYSPAREKEDRKFPEGHLLVEVVEKTKGKPYLKIQRGLGSCARLANSDRKSVPFFWYTTGRILTSRDHRLEQAEFDEALRLVKTLRALTRNWFQMVEDKDRGKVSRWVDGLKDDQVKQNMRDLLAITPPAPEAPASTPEPAPAEVPAEAPAPTPEPKA